MQNVQYNQGIQPPIQNADLLSTLPTDQIQPTHSELKVIDTLFKNKDGTMKKLFSESKKIVLLGILFFLFSLPQVDQLIQKLIPMTETSTYIRVLLKAIVFAVIYWVLNNWYLSRG